MGHALALRMRLAEGLWLWQRWCVLLLTVAAQLDKLQPVRALFLFGALCKAGSRVFCLGACNCSAEHVKTAASFWPQITAAVQRHAPTPGRQWLCCDAAVQHQPHPLRSALCLEVGSFPADSLALLAGVALGGISLPSRLKHLSFRCHCLQHGRTSQAPLCHGVALMWLPTSCLHWMQAC